MNSFVQLSNEMVIADPINDSLGEFAEHDYPSMIIASNVLTGKWHYHCVDKEYSNKPHGIYYILHENYDDLSEKYQNIEHWTPFGETVTLWGRMFGFFDKSFYRNDDIAKDKTFYNFVKSDKKGNAWYNYLNHNYWKGRYAESILEHGCTCYMGNDYFVPADDYSCYYLKNHENKIYGLAVYWYDWYEEDDD
jgi:hypothetical protein